MRILVYPHDLEIGGSQLNAIELATAVRDLGHEVVVYGQRGALKPRIEELGLEFIESPRPSLRPTPQIAAHLRTVVTQREIDIVHGYEWPPILEAQMAVTGTSAVAVGTVMSMSVAPFIPRGLRLVVGTRQIAAYERWAGRSAVHSIEPPVDLGHNGIGHEGDPAEFRRQFDIPAGLHLVVVGRLAEDLKLEGLLTAIERTPLLAPDAVLVIVGDGPARDRVERAAEAANERAGRRAVVLTGEVDDPRPAYALADISLGMGGSALRAMSYGAPLVVQGEKGFWETLTPSSVGQFLWGGWYGVGAGAHEGAARFDAAVQPLVYDAALREQLGAFAMSTVKQRYSLSSAATKLRDVYAAALSERAELKLGTMTSARVFAGAPLRWARFLRDKIPYARAEAREDFNARPVGYEAGTSPANRPLVYLAGSRYDDVEGTDRRMVAAQASAREVLWVDPPRPITDILRDPTLRPRLRTPLVRETASVSRLYTWGPPFLTRRGVRRITAELHARSVNRAATQINPLVPPIAVVAGWLTETSRLRAFPRALYLTDDLGSGGDLLGTDETYLTANMRRQVAASDEIFAVSEELRERVANWGRGSVLLPNGAAPEVAALLMTRAYQSRLSGPLVGLVGTINDRLDVQLVLDLARTGVSLLIVGPRREQTAETREALDELVAMPNVEYVGRVAYAELPAYLASIRVGITPYLDTSFNRASSPLKTLEYLAAGRPVVSTDLPASRRLNTELVAVADDAEEFVRLVHDQLSRPLLPEVAEACRAVAGAHSWHSRAAAMNAVLDGTSRSLVKQPKQRILHDALTTETIS